MLRFCMSANFSTLSFVSRELKLPTVENYSQITWPKELKIVVQV